MEIKILGTGCPNCIILEKNTFMALQKSGIEANVAKVTDIVEIMNYNVMGTPGFVVDEKVMSSGKVLAVDEIIEILNGNIIAKKESPKSSGGCSCGGNC